MKKIAYCLLLLVMVLGFSFVQAQEVVFQSGEVVVVKIGDKLSGGIVIPLYAIRIGDTAIAEIEAILFQKFFGFFSQNAVFYTRGDGEKWQARGYLRPSSQEDVRKFFEDPLYFYAERKVRTEELPAYLGELRELFWVSYIVEYLGGGVKVYPIDGITEEEVISIAKRIAVRWRSVSI